MATPTSPTNATALDPTSDTLQLMARLGHVRFVTSDEPLPKTPETRKAAPTVTAQQTLDRFKTLPAITAAQTQALEDLREKLERYQQFPAKVRALIDAKAQEQYGEANYATLVDRQITERLNEVQPVAGEQFTVTPLCDRLIGLADWLRTHLPTENATSDNDFAQIFAQLARVLDAATSPPEPITATSEPPASALETRVADILKAAGINDPEKLQQLLLAELRKTPGESPSFPTSTPAA